MKQRIFFACLVVLLVASGHSLYMVTAGSLPSILHWTSMLLSLIGSGVFGYYSTKQSSPIPSSQEAPPDSIVPIATVLGNMKFIKNKGLPVYFNGVVSWGKGQTYPVSYGVHPDENSW